jgi:hypothetical protein
MLLMHVCLRVIISTKPTPTPIPDVSGIVGELITLAQVVIEKMAISLDCDDEEDNEGIVSFKSECNFSI